MFYLFFGMLILGISMLFIMLYMKKDGNSVIVEQNGKIIYEISLKDTGTYVIKDGDFYNELVIEDGKAYMKTANCRDLICVNHGAISKVNETITCLPHKLIIYVAGEKISEVDAVVK